MEMQFDRVPLTYLQRLTGQLRSQEQTLEIRLPEGMPDIGRVLGARGQVIVRGKEWNGDHMVVSCGVMAWVLYTPESEEGLRSVEAWLPFSMKWELPDTRYDGKITVSCLLQNVDARSTSARKLMVRATVEAMAEAWQPAQLQQAVPGELPEDVQLLTATYPVLLPQEAGEKAFLLEELLDPSVSGPKPEKLLYYSLQPEIADQKVMGDKVVFRGNALLHVLYRTEEGNLHTFHYDLPFSQYAELEKEYATDPSVSVCPGVTSLDMVLDEDGRIQLRAGLLGQYLLQERSMLTVAEDAYSPNRTVTLQQEKMLLPAVLDKLQQTIHAEQTVAAEAHQVVDAVFYPAYGQSESTATGIKTRLPGQFQLLYYDADGQLQGTAAAWEGYWELDADEHAVANSVLYPTGRPQAAVGMDGISLRADVAVETVTTGGEGICMLAGLEMGETEKPDPNRSGLILCRKGDARLWDLAKRTGSTVAGIMATNHLEGEPDADRILLIPVP